MDCSTLPVIRTLYPLEGIELPYQERIRKFVEKKNYEYLRILESDIIKQAEIPPPKKKQKTKAKAKKKKKKKIKKTKIKEYLRRSIELLETKLYGRNLIKGINNRAVLLLRYSGPFLKWTRKELRQTDQKTRKLMMTQKVLHPRDDIDKISIKKKMKRTR